MIRPGPLLLRLLGLLCVAALLVTVLPPFAWALLALLLGLVVAAGVEALALARVGFSVERRAAVVLSLGEQEQVALAIGTDADRPLHLTLRQTWPALLSEPSTTRRGLVRPGEILRLALPVRAVARGRQSVARAFAAASFFGLVERVTALGEPTEVTVIPDLKAVGRLHAKLNQYVLRGLGSRTSARLGKGREFDRMRDYVAGDELRDVAWKATARHGKLIVREYRLDRSQDVWLCLDRGHRMAARVAGLTKLDHAVNGAVMLAYVCNRMEDRVGMLSFSSDVERGLPVGRGGGHLRRLTDFAASVGVEPLHSDYLALAAHLRRGVRHRALLVVFTALPDLEREPLLRALRMLAPQHLPLVVVLTDPDLEAAARLLPADKPELARVLVAQDLVHGREQTVREMRRLGAMVVQASPGDAGIEAMNAYVEVKRRQLL